MSHAARDRHGYPYCGSVVGGQHFRRASSNPMSLSLTRTSKEVAPLFRCRTFDRFS